MISIRTKRRHFQNAITARCGGNDKYEAEEKNQKLMEPLHIESNRSAEPSVGVPLDVNVVIKDTRDKRNIDSYVNRVNNTIEETTDRLNDGIFVISERKNGKNNQTSVLTVNGVKTDNDVSKKTMMSTVLNDRENENLFFDLRHMTSTEVENTQKGNDFDIVTIDNSENDTSEKEEQSLKKVDEVYENKHDHTQHTGYSGTTNRFLNDLYDKKVDVNNNFSVQEIKDIQEAVEQQVNLLTTTIGEVDSRLKIKKVIPVGSAREGTQIIRPCEYDYILILESLSTSGVVSLTPTETKFTTRTFMHVKLESDHARLVFGDIIDNDYYIRGSHWLPCFKQGLREVFSAAIHQAVKLNSRSSIMKNTGKLKIRRWKPDSHGPAFTIRLVWKRRVANAHTTMEISVDLCPALKLKRERHRHVLPSSDNSVLAELGCIELGGSVLLMPREGMHFKLTFTEAELAYTSHLSQHHRKCYKLLKFIVNGDPFPREQLTLASGILKHFQEANTSFHSHALKAAVWKHHYTEKCTEDKNSGFCVMKMLESIQGKTDNPGFRPTPSKESLSNRRIATLRKSLRNLNSTPIENYNYEACYREIGARGLSKCPAKISAITSNTIFSISLLLFGIGCIITVLTVGWTHLSELVIGSTLLLCSIVCILFAPCISCVKRYVLTQRSSKCTASCINLFYIVSFLISYLIGLGLLVTTCNSPIGQEVLLVVGVGVLLHLFLFCASRHFYQYSGNLTNDISVSSRLNRYGRCNL